MITITRTRKPKKKRRFSKWVVMLIILLNSAFALGTLYIFFRVGSEPITLISCWFGFTTVELWQLAGIRKNESKKSEVVYDEKGEI